MRFAGKRILVTGGARGIGAATVRQLCIGGLEVYAVARSADDYRNVYHRILSQVREPVIIHWLGEMFDPALEGYWGNADHMQAMETALQVIHAHAAKVDGVKVAEAIYTAMIVDEKGA